MSLLGSNPDFLLGGRTSASADKSCFKSQSENPVNQGLSSAILGQYCVCFANKLADSTSPAEIAELDKLSLRDPVAVAARQGALIKSLGEKCGEEVFK
jgi:predicted GTPase